MKQTRKSLHPQLRKVGGETPVLGTPLVGRSPERVLAEAQRVLAARPDLIEWRVDHFAGIADVARVLDTARELRAAVGTLPLVFTCRWAEEGGEAVPIDEEAVVALYEAAAVSRLFDFADYELHRGAARVQRVRAATRKHRVRLILSYHNFSYTPPVDHLVQQFLEAERAGADAAMVSVMPRDRADVLALLVATERADHKTQIPLISMSMGPLGSVSRMIGGLFGSALSYGVGESASAPGQIPLGDLVTVCDIVRRARGGEMF